MVRCRVPHSTVLCSLHFIAPTVNSLPYNIFSSCRRSCCRRSTHTNTHPHNSVDDSGCGGRIQWICLCPIASFKIASEWSLTSCSTQFSVISFRDDIDSQSPNWCWLKFQRSSSLELGRSGSVNSGCFCCCKKNTRNRLAALRGSDSAGVSRVKLPFRHNSGHFGEAKEVGLLCYPDPSL